MYTCILVKYNQITQKYNFRTQKLEFCERLSTWERPLIYFVVSEMIIKEITKGNHKLDLKHLHMYVCMFINVILVVNGIKI